MHISRVFRS